jgi:hypothetical protein
MGIGKRRGKEYDVTLLARYPSQCGGKVLHQISRSFFLLSVEQEHETRRYRITPAKSDGSVAGPSKTQTKDKYVQIRGSLGSAEEGKDERVLVEFVKSKHENYVSVRVTLP